MITINYYCPVCGEAVTRKMRIPVFRRFIARWWRTHKLHRLEEKVEWKSLHSVVTVPRSDTISDMRMREYVRSEQFKQDYVDALCQLLRERE